MTPDIWLSARTLLAGYGLDAAFKTRRCELWEVRVKERAIEIHHIIPRKHGGSDETTNLQVLCYICNANRRPRRHPL